MKHEEQKISYPGLKSYWVFQETAPQESMILQILVSIISIFTSHKNFCSFLKRANIPSLYMKDSFKYVYCPSEKSNYWSKQFAFYLHLWNLISKECEQNFKKIYATVRNYHLCPSIYELHDISCGKHPYSHFDTWFSAIVRVDSYQLQASLPICKK